jgi:hypothetical protein
MTQNIAPIIVLAALTLSTSTALADDHIPGPDESSTPSAMLASSSSGARVIQQRQSRTTYRAVRGDRVDDARYLGREIPLDIASVSRGDGAPLALDVTLWESPTELAPEAMVVYFAEAGALAPQWAAYQAAPQDDELTPAWALYAYNPASGIFDARVADAIVTLQGDTIAFTADRDDDMPRRLLAFVETRSSDSEDWAWKDQAPTRRQGLRIR